MNVSHDMSMFYALQDTKQIFSSLHESSSAAAAEQRVTWAIETWPMADGYPPIILTYVAIWKMAIYSGFSHDKWWFPTAMLDYQRVCDDMGYVCHYTWG